MNDQESREQEEREQEEEDRRVFNLQIELYNNAARDVAEMGYKEALRTIRYTKENIQDAVPGLTSEERELLASTDEHELQRCKERAIDLVNAIERGMTLQEFLESDSAHAWLDRQQAEGGEA